MFRSTLFVSIAALVVGALGSSAAQARCSIRVADPLIKGRYQACNQKEFISYLYNDLVTPFSFTCAKKLSETCQKENCSNPKSPEEEKRCLSRYVAVLDECPEQIEGAAKMARCKDTKAWPSLTGSENIQIARAQIARPERRTYHPIRPSKDPLGEAPAPPAAPTLTETAHSGPSTAPVVEAPNLAPEAPTARETYGPENPALIHSSQSSRR